MGFPFISFYAYILYIACLKKSLKYLFKRIILDFLKRINFHDIIFHYYVFKELVVVV